MVVFDRLREVYVACDVRPFVPVLDETFKDESSFADASRTMEDERLRNSVVLSVVVE